MAIGLGAVQKLEKSVTQSVLLDTTPKLARHMPTILISE
jgi:hypothetical protein